MDSLEIKDSECHTNKRGRPRTADVIHFTPQPKSLIISELVNKTNTKEFSMNKQSLVEANLTDNDSFGGCVDNQQYIRNNERRSMR